MKILKKFLFASVFFAVVLFMVRSQATAPAPRLTGRVNDYANLMSPAQKEQLEQKLAEFEAKTTDQVVVLTVPSLEGEDIEGFSIRVAETWKIGQKDKNNGVILLVAPKEHKVRIEVGYGLEGALPDIIASRIIREIIIPTFREGKFYDGIDSGVDAIMSAIKGEFKAPETDRFASPTIIKNKTRSTLSLILGILVFLILISTRTGRFILFTSFLMGMGGSGGRSGGGFGFSGGGGSFGGGGASGSW